MKPANLTPLQLDALYVIGALDDPTGRDIIDALSERHDVQDDFIYRVLKQLRRYEDLIEKRDSPHDKRSSIYSLSIEARRIVEADADWRREQMRTFYD